MMTIPQFLDRTATIGTILASAAVVWIAAANVITRPARPITAGSKRTVPAPTQLQSLREAHTEGSPAAKVALIEYADFQCPFCARFAAETLPVLQEKYIRSNRAILIFRHYPLEIHKFALVAAEGAECAGAQGHFWQMHDAMFADQKHLDRNGILEKAGSIGLKLPDFETCLKAGDDTKIKVDVAFGKSVGVAGTPLFLIGIVQSGGVSVNQVIDGARPLADFEAALDASLRQAR